MLGSPPAHAWLEERLAHSDERRVRHSNTGSLVLPRVFASQSETHSGSAGAIGWDANVSSGGEGAEGGGGGA